MPDGQEQRHRCPVENKPTLIICGSNKGGVGKTTIARAMLDYFKDKGVRPSVFDTEDGDGVLRRFHKYAKPIDVIGVRGQMEIFDEVPKAGYTFVDLKAGGLSRVLDAMRNNGVLQDVKASEMRMVALHVLGSNEASLREIAEVRDILTDCGGEHVLIKNHSSDGLFFEWDRERYAGYFRPTDLLLEIPHLDGMAADAVDAAGAHFAEFRKKDFLIEGKPVSRVLSGYVNTWLGQVWAEFDKAKLC